MKTTLRPPTPVGEILRNEFMVPMNLTVGELATALNVHRNTVSALLHDQSRLTSIMAHKLARVFNTTPVFWLNLQQTRDIWNHNQLHGSIA